MEAESCYPGSAGELIQGNFKGRDVLLSFPVNLYTKVKVFETKFPVNKYKNDKTAMFMRNMLTRWKCENFEKMLDIKICSHIPVGKGFASSTADLCALYNALLMMFNRKFNQQELIEECIRIEPTDSIIFREMTLFDYKRGTFHEPLGNYIEFFILAYEGPNVVNTIEFNKRSFQPLAEIDDLVSGLKDAIIKKDIRKIGLISSESILRNQHRLKYDLLEKILETSRKNRGCGIIGAHSGDCLGIIFENESHAKYVQNKYPSCGGYKSYILKSVKI